MHSSDDPQDPEARLPRDLLGLRMIDDPLISFVIPTLNEEDFLGGLLASIQDACPAGISHEVIVVDNGSSDQTVEVARMGGAGVLVRPDGTIGHLRNEGAREARGQILVFLDADVRLSTLWSENIGRVLSSISAKPHAISGSSCRAPPDSGWVSSAWSDFSRRSKKRPTHIGTGHMIVKREAFLGLGGFDTSLETGEDFEFCRRAVAKGFQLQPERTLFVTHSRLPRTIREFMQREIWHGSGDSNELSRLLTSQVALVSVVFVVLHLTVIPWVWWAPAQLRLVAPLIVFAGLLGLCLSAAVRRGGTGNLRRLLQRTALFYLYFWSRFLAVCRGVSRRSRGNSGRPGKARGW